MSRLAKAIALDILTERVLKALSKYSRRERGGQRWLRFGESDTPHGAPRQGLHEERKSVTRKRGGKTEHFTQTYWVEDKKPEKAKGKRPDFGKREKAKDEGPDLFSERKDSGNAGEKRSLNQEETRLLEQMKTAAAGHSVAWNVDNAYTVKLGIDTGEYPGHGMSLELAQELLKVFREAAGMASSEEKYSGNAGASPSLSPVKGETTMNAVIKKTGKDGRTVEIKLHRYAGQHVAQAYLDGKYVGTGDPTKLNKRVGDTTHYLSHTKPAIGLTSEEAKAIIEAIRVADEAERQTPSGKLDTLRAERQRLAAEVSGHMDDADDAVNRAHDRGIVDVGYHERAKHVEAAEEARERLAQFDAEHPEILAAIKKEREEKANRHQWD